MGKRRGKLLPLEVVEERIRVAHGDVAKIVPETYVGVKHRASYEVAFVTWCNENRIDFDWQVPVKTDVLTPWGRRSTYFVDAYVKTGELADTWIELKGTWNRKNGHVGKAKWEWYHEKHSNSQLWMKDELVRRGILGKKSNV